MAELHRRHKAHQDVRAVAQQGRCRRGGAGGRKESRWWGVVICGLYDLF